jgi:hypothetical protein
MTSIIGDVAYIFIGIEAKQGRPVQPPADLPKKELDKIQKELNLAEGRGTGIPKILKARIKAAKF